jgi:hypothetical protein
MNARCSRQPNCCNRSIVPTALALLVDYLGRQPDSANARLVYARMLIADSKFDAARAQFEGC